MILQNNVRQRGGGTSPYEDAVPKPPFTPPHEGVVPKPPWPPDPSGPGPGVGNPPSPGGFPFPDLSKIIPLLGAGKPPFGVSPPPDIPHMGTFNQAPGGMSPTAQAVSTPSTTSSPSSRAGSGRGNQPIPIGQQNSRTGQSGAARNPFIEYDPMTDPSRPPPDPAPPGFEWHWDESSFRWAQRATTDNDSERPPKPDPIPGYEWYWDPVGKRWTRLLTGDDSVIPDPIPPKPDPIPGYDWHWDSVGKKWVRLISDEENIFQPPALTPTPTPTPTTPTTTPTSPGTTDPFQGFEDYETKLMEQFGFGSDIALDLARTGGITDAHRKAVRGRADDSVTGITDALKRQTFNRKAITGGGVTFDNVASRIQDQGSRTGSDVRRDAELGLSQTETSNRMAGLAALFGGNQAQGQFLLGKGNQNLNWANIVGNQELGRGQLQNSRLNAIASLLGGGFKPDASMWDRIMQALGAVGPSIPGLIGLAGGKK